MRRFLWPLALPALLAASAIAAAAPVSGTASASRPADAAPAALFATAESAFASLRADARAQRQHENFMRVLDAYRRVFEKHPASRQAEQSLMRAGALYTLLFRWTGQEGDLNRSQNYYQRLIQNYPKSSLVDDARLAIAYLYLDQLKNPEQAWLRFSDVVRLSPEGDAVPEARRQLRQLARHAPTESPAPPPGDLPDPACPTPGTATTPSTATAPPSSASPPRPSAAAATPATPAPAAARNRVRDIRHWSNPEYTRVVIDLDQATLFYSNILEDRSGAGKPPRIYIDLFDSIVEGRLCKPVSVDDGILLGIRAGQYTPDSVRIVLDIDALRTYRVFPMQNPFRIVVDVTGGTPPPGSELATLAPDGAPTALPAASETTFSLPTPAPIAPDAVPELAPLPPLPGSERPAPSSTAPAASPPIAAAPGAEPQKPAPAPEPPRSTQPPRAPAAPRPSSPAAAKPVKNAPAPSRPAAPPPADGKLSLARQLGLGIRRVVIDAGHGAHDPGAPGVGGLQEKEVTLDVALRLREILQSSGYDTILTRDRDVYLPLEERTALANTSRGDLFISVHCNASDAGNLSGIETYFLNLASTRRAMATAARENSMALANMSDLQDLLKEIYTSKMDESSRFADAVQRSLHAALRRKYPDIKDLGVKQAPFYVLIGAQMPSVLAEISFINHKKEGRRLADPLYRQLIAEALAEGVKRYAKTVKTAALTPAAVAER